jgi:serine/threonine protein kinase
VALKVIKPDLAETSGFIQRFKREAETVATLSHPHILKLFDYGEQDGIVYLVMELLTGGSLGDLIPQGPLSMQEASRFLDEIAAALDYAHRRGVIHRDLKPQNVLLDEDRNAFLSDFGIAKLLDENTVLTQSGASIGTPAYMAPEQWQGQTVDARTDVYALAIILFEMLSGKLPFNADTPYHMMHLHVSERPPLMSNIRPDLPPSIDQLMARALAKQPEQRFPSGGELATAFRALLPKNGEAIVNPISTDDRTTAIGVPPGSEVTTLVPPAAAPASVTRVNKGRSRGVIGVMGAIALLALVGLALLLRPAGNQLALQTRVNTVALTNTPVVAVQASTSTQATTPAPTQVPVVATQTADCSTQEQTLIALQTAVAQVTIEAARYEATFAALRKQP